MTDITEADLLQAIQEALETGSGPAGLEPGTVTAPRLAEQFDIPQPRARKILRQMTIDGKVKPDRVVYTDDWGYKQRVKGYRLITEKPGG